MATVKDWETVKDLVKDWETVKDLVKDWETVKDLESAMASSYTKFPRRL